MRNSVQRTAYTPVLTVEDAASGVHRRRSASAVVHQGLPPSCRRTDVAVPASKSSSTQSGGPAAPPAWPRRGDDCSSLVQQQAQALQVVKSASMQQNALHLQRHVVTPAVGATLQRVQHRPMAGGIHIADPLSWRIDHHADLEGSG